MNANLWMAYDATRLEQLDGETDMRMNVFRSFAGIAAIAVATLVFGQQPGAPSAAAKASAAERGAAAARGLSVANKARTGDFDRMLERRMPFAAIL